MMYPAIKLYGKDCFEFKCKTWKDAHEFLNKKFKKTLTIQVPDGEIIKTKRKLKPYTAKFTCYNIETVQDIIKDYKEKGAE